MLPYIKELVKTNPGLASTELTKYLRELDTDNNNYLFNFIRSINFSTATATCDIDLKSKMIRLNPLFFRDEIESIDDLLFLTLHERHHLVLHILYPHYKMSSVIEDIYINKLIYHTFIQSKLPVRYYADEVGIYKYLSPLVHWDFDTYNIIEMKVKAGSDVYSDFVHSILKWLKEQNLEGDIPVQSISTTDNSIGDGGSRNKGSEDSGSEDSGSEDSGSEDSGSEDSGSEDSGSEDSGSEDSGSEDSGSEDSGSEDSGSEDSGSEDSGSEDSGSEDSGSEDSGSGSDANKDATNEDEGENDYTEDDCVQREDLLENLSKPLIGHSQPSLESQPLHEESVKYIPYTNFEIWGTYDKGSNGTVDKFPEKSALDNFDIRLFEDIPDLNFKIDSFKKLASMVEKIESVLASTLADLRGDPNIRGKVPVFPTDLSYNDIYSISQGYYPIMYDVDYSPVESPEYAIYFDVSGSMSKYLVLLPGIYDYFKEKLPLENCYYFSTNISSIDPNFEYFMSTGGTSFVQVAEHIFYKNFNRVIVVSDGEGSLTNTQFEQLSTLLVDFIYIKIGKGSLSNTYDPFFRLSNALNSKFVQLYPSDVRGM